VKKASQKVQDSGIFGILDNTKSINSMAEGASNSLGIVNPDTRREIRKAVLEAEYGKALVIELTNKMKYM